MTRQLPDQFSVVIGHRWSGTDDPQALTGARSAIFGQLAFLAAASGATDPDGLYLTATWLDQFFPRHARFYFGLCGDGPVIGADEAVVAAQSARTWRIDTATAGGKEWMATFCATLPGHGQPGAQDAASIAMSLPTSTIRALIMATIEQDGDHHPEFWRARRQLLWFLRHELTTNPGADVKDWMAWMPEMVFREYERLPITG